MKRIFLITLLISAVAGCSSLTSILPGSDKKTSTDAKVSSKPLSAAAMREACCFEEAEIEAATAAEECIPTVQRIKLVSTCETCSAFIVSAKTRKSCDK